MRTKSKWKMLNAAGAVTLGALCAIAPSQTTWTDVTTSTLSNSLGQGRGAAWVDVDLDGDLDLYVTNWDTPNKLFLQVDGVFIDATKPPLHQPGFSGRSVWGDFDRDGDDDVYIAQSQGSKLLRNDGYLVFTDLTQDINDPLSMKQRLARGCAWVDYDNDGWLDLHVSSAQLDNKDRLFHNVSGSLVDAMIPVFEAIGTGRGMEWADYDDDGDLDCYLCNGFPGSGDDGTLNYLFRNDGGGMFTDVTVPPLEAMNNSRGVTWGDYDLDGDFDLFITAVSVGGGSANQLLRNDGGVFVDVTTPELGDTANTRDCAFVDMDNDGDLDLLTINTNANHGVYINDGVGNYAIVSAPPLTSLPFDAGNAAAWGDYDEDGDLDVYIANRTSNFLIRNDLNNGNHWLEVDLNGTVSNRNAIGARVTITAGGVTQLREVRSGSSYLAHHMQRLHFGLNTADMIDSLTVRWPAGLVEVFNNVPADQILELTEPGPVQSSPPPPPITRQAWFDWYDDELQARKNASDFARDATRWLSISEGNDANDGLTFQTPWATIAAAQAWLDSPNPTSDRRQVLLKRGDVWRVSQGLASTAPGTRVSDWGLLASPPPRITGFTTVINADDPAWQIASGAAFSRPEATGVSWVREDGDVDLASPLSKQDSLVQVEATPGSWWWNDMTGTLYLHPRAGDDPRSNGKVYELAYTTGAGIVLSGDGSMVERVRVDGFGLTPNLGSTGFSPLLSQATGMDRVMFRDCEAYYGGSRVIAHDAGAAPNAGGAPTFIRCVAGLPTLDLASGEAVFYSNAGAGENGALFADCTALRGTLPTLDFTGRRGLPALVETGPGATVAETVIRNLTITNHANGCAGLPLIRNAPAVDSIEKVRAFVVGAVHEGGQGGADSNSHLFQAGVASANCRYMLAPATPASSALQLDSVDGWLLNSTIELDLSQIVSPVFGLYDTSVTTNKPRVWNSGIYVSNIDMGTEFRIDADGAGSSPAGVMLNTILARLSGLGTVQLNLPDAAVNVQANGYWQVAAPVNDAGAVVLASAPVVDMAPDAMSPLVAAATSLNELAILEFDFNELGRPDTMAQTIGPFETNGNSSIVGDLNGDGLVTSADLAILLGAWGTANPIADIDGDGFVGSADMAVVLGAWTL